MIAKVKYRIATYRGIVSVPCSENDDTDFIIAKAKSIVQKQSGPFPFGSEYWKIISVE